MLKKPLISIIILNYNAGDLILNCINSVVQTKYKNYEIILVDNISTDNSHKKCKEKFKQIQLIENSKNYGYCEGNNIGIRKANGEFIVILNPDTIVEPNWLDEFLIAHSKYGDGLYQPKILSLYEKEILQSTGNMIHLFGFGFARDKGVKDKNQFNKIEKIGYASGTCLFTSFKVLDKIGLLDPFLFLYHDDLDLGWRAAQLGINSYFVPNVKILHAESYILKWSSKKFYWLERNRKYCILTHFSKHTYKKMRLNLLLIDCLVWIFYISKGFLFAKIKAELNIRKNKNQIEKKYLELENKKIISDEKLIKEFPDKIFVPINVAKGNVNNLFNSILEKLSKKVKKKILKKIS
jgi:GT2 family glycosyltransferase